MKRNASREHQEFNKVVSDYFDRQEQNPDVDEDVNVPVGKDGEPLSPRGRELKQILEEERLCKKNYEFRSKSRLQDNLSWILDIQDDEEDAEEAYNILLEIVQNVSTYHNQAGKKAERLLKILKDPTSMNKSVE